jgi:hypothetical protein
MGTLHEVQYIFWVIFCSFPLKIRNFSNKLCRGKQKAHFVFNIIFVENRTVYEKMWKKYLVPGRPQMTIWRMRIASWIKSTNTQLTIHV